MHGVFPSEPVGGMITRMLFLLTCLVIIEKNTLCYYCALCGWKSCRVKQEDIAAMVFLMLSNPPLVFWHTYPPSLYLLNIFTRLTKEHIKWLLPVCQSSLKFGLLIRVDFMMITWIDWIVAVHKVLFLTLHFYKNIEYCEWSQHLCSCIEQLPIKHSSSLYVKTAASQRKSHPSFLSNTQSMTCSTIIHKLYSHSVVQLDIWPEYYKLHHPDMLNTTVGYEAQTGSGHRVFWAQGSLVM